MKLSAVLGLETSKSVKALNDITNGIQSLFNIRNQDQAREAKYFQQGAALTKQEMQDAKKFEQQQFRNARDYERSIEQGKGSGRAAELAMLLGGGVLAANLLGKATSLKTYGGSLFSENSDFTKEFTQSFEKETKKRSTSSSSSTPSSSSSQPTKKPQGQVATQGKGKSFEHYKYLTGTLGLSDHHARGLVANAIRESSLNAKARSGDDGGPGGLFQWKGSRQTETVRKLVESGDWRGQYKYALTEDVGPQYQPQRFNSAQAAADWWMRKWERPARPEHDSKKHRKILSELGFQKGGEVRQNDDNSNPQAPGGNRTRISGGSPSKDGFDAGNGSKSRRIFLHWTAGSYDQTFGNYHTVFLGSGQPVRQTKYDQDKNQHTAGANTNSIGLSLAAMKGGSESAARRGNMGSHPPTDAQIKSMALEIARIAKAWGWNASDIDKNVMTHGEWERYATSSGLLPGGPQRWDLDILKAGDQFGSGGPKLRSMAKSMLQQLAQGQQPASVGAPTEYSEADNKSESNQGNPVQEDNKDQKQIRQIISTPNIVSELTSMGPLGEMILGMVKATTAAAGFDIFGLGNLEPTVQNVVTGITPSQSSAQAAAADAPASEQEQKKTAAAVTEATTVIKNIVKTNHPDTGSGYTVKGLMDYKQRPAVFSQAAAYHFSKMMQDANGAIKGSDISSSQRSKSKNASLPGAHHNSSHLYGEALDVIGSTMDWMKANGSKYHWSYGYSHGSNSAHFNYKGPEQLSLNDIQQKQSGGVVSMQTGGSIASQFNSTHSSPTNKYQRPVVIIQKPKSMSTPSMSIVDEAGSDSSGKMSASVVSTSMYKFARGSRT